MNLAESISQSTRKSNSLVLWFHFLRLASSPWRFACFAYIAISLEWILWAASLFVACYSVGGPLINVCVCSSLFVRFAHSDTASSYQWGGGRWKRYSHGLNDAPVQCLSTLWAHYALIFLIYITQFISCGHSVTIPSLRSRWPIYWDAIAINWPASIRGARTWDR